MDQKTKGRPEAEKELEPESFVLIRIVMLLGACCTHLHKYSDAEEYFKRNLSILSDVVGREHPRYLNGRKMVAVTLQAQGLESKSESILLETREMQAKVLGGNHPETLNTEYYLAKLYSLQKQYDKAETLLRQIVNEHHDITGTDNSLVLGYMQSLADVLVSQGKYEDADLTLERIAEIQSAQWGKQNESFLSNPILYTNLLQAMSTRNQGNRVETAKHLTPFFESMIAFTRPLVATKGEKGKEALARTLDAYAQGLLLSKKFDTALPICEEYLQIRQAEHPGTWRKYHAQSMMGSVFTGLQMYADAEPLLIQGFEGLQQHSREFSDADIEKYVFEDAVLRLIELYTVWKKPEKSKQWHKLLVQIEAAKPRAFQLNELAEEAAKKGDLARALEVYEQIAILPGQPRPRKASELYARTLQWEKAAEAFRITDGENAWRTLMCLYESGDIEGYLQGRAAMLTDEDIDEVHDARVSLLHPVEEEFHDFMVELAEANSPEATAEEWRYFYVGPMMYRAGKFREWYDALPDDSPLRPMNRVLAAVTAYQNDSSEQHFRKLQDELILAEQRARNLIRDGTLSKYWDGFISNITLIREAKRVLGDPDADETGKQIHKWLELQQQALQAAQADELQRAIALYEQSAELPGESLDYAAVLNLYPRTLQWDKAAEAYRIASPQNIWTILLYYQSGRHDEYRAARKFAMKNFESYSKNEVYNLPWIMALLPLEENVIKDAQQFVNHLEKQDDLERWQKASIGRLVYRLGTFEDWYSQQDPQVHNVRDIQLTKSVIQYENDPSEQNRQQLERITALLKSDALTSINVETETLVSHWPGYLKNVLHFQMGRTALGDANQGNNDEELLRLAKANIQYREVVSKAKQVVEQDQVDEAIKLYEQAAELVGPLFKESRQLADLYSRKLQWNKAAEWYRHSSAPTDVYYLCALYAAGQEQEYREVRRQALLHSDQVTDGSLWNLATAITLLPVEEEFHAEIRKIVDRLDGIEIEFGWQPARIGRLRQRLGEFEDWFRQQSEEVQNTGEVRMTAAVVRFTADPSTENRSLIERQISGMENRLRGSQYLTSNGLTETYFPNYVRALSYYREALTTLGAPNARATGHDFLELAKLREQAQSLAQRIRDADAVSARKLMDDLLATAMEGDVLLTLGNDLAQQGRFHLAWQAIARVQFLEPIHEDATRKALELAAYLGKSAEFNEIRTRVFATALQQGISDGFLRNCLLMPVDKEEHEIVRQLAAERKAVDGEDELQAWIEFRTDAFAEWSQSPEATSLIQKNGHLLLMRAVDRAASEKSFVDVAEVAWRAARARGTLQRLVLRDDFPGQWMNYAASMALVREAFEVIDQEGDFGDIDIAGLRKAYKQSQELIQQAEAAAKEEKLTEAIALFEQAAALAGPLFDNHYLLGDLYGRTLRWDKALSAYLVSAGATNAKTLRLLYETGRIDDYRTARRVVLETIDQLDDKNVWLYDICTSVALLPLEKELHDQARKLAAITANLDSPDAWRRNRLGILKFRLGEFEEFFAGEGEDDGQRQLENRICQAMLAYGAKPSDANRQTLQELSDNMEQRLRGSIQDGVLNHPFWFDYIRQIAYYRAAQQALGEKDVQNAGKEIGREQPNPGSDE